MTFWQITLELLHGFGLTCLLFVLTLVFAMPLGLGLSFCTMSRFKPLRAVSRVFVWIIRGIPLMLFICMIYYLSRQENKFLLRRDKLFPDILAGKRSTP